METTKMKKTLNSIISLAMMAIMFSCNKGTDKSVDKDGNAIPYPNSEWKGVQGKTLADSKPDFIGQPKAPEGSSQCDGHNAG
jgi:hypothetical protein